MMYDAEARRRYKAQARTDIRQKFWPTMGAVILYMLPILLIGEIYEISTKGVMDELTAGSFTVEMLSRVYGGLAVYLIACILIASPLQFGIMHYFVARARGQESSPAMVFSCFASGKKYLTSIKIMLCILIRSLGWMILAGVAAGVGTVAMIALGVLISQGVMVALSAILIVVIAAALLAIALLAAVKVRRYDGAYICMIDTPDASVWAATGSCAPIFKHHNWELLVFDWSFILWYLLGLVTLGIGLIYVSAYVNIAFVHYFDALCGKNAQPDMPEMLN